MTWDVYALRRPIGVRRLEDMPDGYVGPSIGSPDEVVEMIRDVVPDLQVRPRGWLELHRGDELVEVSLGKGIDVREVTFYLAGAGGVPLVLEVCEHLRVTPYDTESGAVLTADSAPPVPPPPDPDEERAGGFWRRLFRRE